MAEATKSVEETDINEIEQAEVLHMLSVRIGAETFFVGSTDPASANKGAKRLFEMARRVDQDDAFFRVRLTDDGEFAEFVSPSLGYAVKAVSKYNNPGVTEHYIGAGTPWVRWIKGDEEKKTDGYSEVMFDQDAFDYEPRMKELNELGFTEPNVWYPASREKMKVSTSDKKKWVWKSIA